MSASMCRMVMLIGAMGMAAEVGAVPENSSSLAPLTIAGVEGRPLVASADYANVSFGELISVYKKAYADAGFELKEQTILKQEARDGRKTTSLIFEYPNPDHPRMVKGVVSFLIVSSHSASQNCTPCSVYPQVFGGAALLQQSLEDYGRFVERMTSADARASEQIGMKLGKSARPARSMIRCGPEINC